eukprot:gene8630-17970_t
MWLVTIVLMDVYNAAQLTPRTRHPTAACGGRRPPAAGAGAIPPGLVAQVRPAAQLATAGAVLAWLAVEREEATWRFGLYRGTVC